jgi:hypothetical protein
MCQNISLSDQVPKVSCFYSVEPYLYITTESLLNNPILTIKTTLPAQAKIQSQRLLGKLAFSFLDHSHQATVTWLIHGLRRTRRDLNGGFYYQDKLKA